MKYRVLVAFLTVLALVSCGKKGTERPVQKPGKSDIEELNRFMVTKDRERIQNYIERKGLKMTETPTGIWFQVLGKGSGRKIEANSKVVMEYECSLLDGTKCYSSDESGPRSITLGSTQIEPGLYEGLRMLNYGDQAIFILPPYMAYGMPGDGKLIPPRSVIVYKVHILQPENLE